MNTANTSKSRGTIVKVPDATAGILFVNGKQQPFTLERVWKSPVAPAANQVVDVEFDGAGGVIAITVVDQQQLAKERLTELGGVAQERGKEAAMLAQQGIGALAGRMGKLALGAAALVWIAWFLLPAAGFSGGPMAAESYSFWTLLGTDFSNEYSAFSPGHHHGFFAFIGLLAIIAPFAAPFLKAPWSRYLYAAPLAYVVLGFIAIHMNTNKAFGELVKAGVPNPFSWHWGVYVLVLAAVVLAAQARKPAAK
jgi:hypothetical protein